MASHGITRSGYAQQSRDEHLRERELKKIKEYNELADIVQAKRSAGDDYTLSALELTTRLLKLNPEYYTIWNYRREILQRTLLAPYAPQATSPPPFPGNDAQDIGSVASSLQAAYHSEISLHLKEELSFLLPLLSSFPKCYWIWNHRLWTLQQATLLLPAEKSGMFWQEELGLVGLMLRRDMRNFHGWMYRRFVIEDIENPRGGHHKPEREGQVQGVSLVEQEFAYTIKMVQGVGGMSNYSAWHNRSKLIPTLLNERKYGEQQRMDFLEDELDLLKRNISTNPHDQSLWFYHRWLIYSNSVATTRNREEPIAPFMSRGTRMLMLAEEIDTLKELLDHHAECKNILKALVLYQGLLQRLRREPRGGSDDEEEEEEEEEEEDVDEESEKADMKDWLKRLVAIDPMRRGRYSDLELELVG